MSLPSSHSLDPSSGVLRPTAPAEAGVDARWLAIVAIASVAIRVLLASMAMALYHRTLFDLSQLRDGPSYVHMAQSLLGDSSLLTPFDRRVFIGYPALIAALGLVAVPVYVVALLESWISAGASVALAGRLFESRRVALACAFVLPSFLLTTTIVANEGPLLLLMLAALCLFQRGRVVPAGVLLGIAGAVRPVACFAVLGAIAVEFRERRWGRGIAVGAIAASVLAVEMLAYRRWSGDVMQNVAIYSSAPGAYAGHLFAWPFQTLIETPFIGPVARWKIVYVWALVAIVLGGNALAIRKTIASWRNTDERASLDLLAAVWLAGNTLFVLCVGRYWGFHEFHRFILPALPPLAWAYRGYLPGSRRAAVWIATGTVSATLAMFALRLG